ncbi:MAG: SPFH domain-containing protein [Eubacteriales bacterium]
MQLNEIGEIKEIKAKASGGMAALLLNIVGMAAAVAATVAGAMMFETRYLAPGIILFVAGMIYLCAVDVILFMGLKILKPNEALVLTLFGKYYGTLRGEGFYYVNPFCVAVNPAVRGGTKDGVSTGVIGGVNISSGQLISRKLSLKAMTLDNKKQKINDLLGNPIEIGIIVIWRVVNTAQAVFAVDNYMEYLSIQCDSALRNIVRLYPYDVSRDGDEKSLRSSSVEIAEKLKDEIQSKVGVAGLEIIEARITYLAYAPEIAAAMLQRQQASAVIDARQMIVEGAVGMVEMALERLSEKEIVQLDEERKAQMVSNLLVVLCGNHDAQPIVNSGSIY